MDAIPREDGAIMPLADTVYELDGAPAALERLWSRRADIAALADALAKRQIRRVMLVGSGDSLVAAEFAAATFEARLNVACCTRQSYEFIQRAAGELDAFCVVIIISASGRPSPVVDALRIAAASPAQTVALSNWSGGAFSAPGAYCLATGAVKRGIPSQSTSAALLALLILATELGYRRGKTNGQERYEALSALAQTVDALPKVQRDNRRYWQAQDRTRFFQRRPVFLATGDCAATAFLAANLLSCGPQLSADAFLLEEYHHSLRLLQVTEGQCFILFSPDLRADELTVDTAARLAQRGAEALIVSAEHYFAAGNGQESLNGGTNFYHIAFLQELALRLSVDFINRGGVRASLMREERQ